MQKIVYSPIFKRVEKCEKTEDTGGANHKSERVPRNNLCFEYFLM